MAYNPKYKNVTNKAGKRVLTNGYATGEHIGSVLQDNLVEGVQTPFLREESFIHVGGILLDSANNPEIINQKDLQASE